MEDLKAVVGDQSEPRDEQLSKHTPWYQSVRIERDRLLAENSALREQVRELVAALEDALRFISTGGAESSTPIIDKANDILSKVKAS